MTKGPVLGISSRCADFVIFSAQCGAVQNRFSLGLERNHSGGKVRAGTLC